MSFDHPIVAANQLGPSLPDPAILEEYAPHAAWKMAWRQAGRAPRPQRFRMGAAIWHHKEGVLGGGCSHTSEKRSRSNCLTTHAEIHALQRTAHLNLNGASILIVSLNPNGNGCAWSSCPCVSCAKALYNRGVSEVLYPERQEDGRWTVVAESPEEMLLRAPKEMTAYARGQRLTSRAYPAGMCNY